MATYGNPVYRGDLSASMSKVNNIQFDFNTNSYLLNRAPEYYVYLFNVSEETYKVSRPPILRELIIPGRKANEDYATVTKLPQPLLLPKGNVDSNDIDIMPQDTRRFVMDIINPDNLGLDQDAVADPRYALSQGNNLGAKGVFWSLNEIPTDKEVTAARTRMEKYYTFLLEQARSTEVSNPQELRMLLTPEHHRAADYYGEEHSWHGKKSRPMDCPVCGERVKAGIAYHIDASNELCIIDWARTVKAGKRTRSQAFDATGDPQFAPRAPEVVPAAKQVAPKNNIPTE
jgi:hypothetical protein